MRELNESEEKNIGGGAAGYGNVQYKCVCGREFLTEQGWANHVEESKHKSAKIYYQQKKGVSSKGSYIGTVKAQIKGMKITLTYPNGKVKKILAYENEEEDYSEWDKIH